MELLPIIYTTLLIFSGLALVTIIISYISFKVKKSAQAQVKTKKTPVTPPQIKKISSSNLDKQKKHTPGGEVVIKTVSKQEKKKSASSKEKTYPAEKRKTVKPRKNRIEILNKTKNDNSFPSGLKKQSGSKKSPQDDRKDKNRSKKNFFDNYNEDRNDSFHPLG